MKSATINKRYLKTIPALLAALLITACGGGGSGGSDTAAAETQTTLASDAALQTPNQNAETAAVAAETGSAAAESNSMVVAASAEDMDRNPASPETNDDATAGTADTVASGPASQEASATAETELTPVTAAAMTVAGTLSETFDKSTKTAFGTSVINHKRVALASGKGVNGTSAIKVDYVGNSEGSERVLVSSKLPRAKVYTLSFDVNFCSGFDFAKGGKLHGLGPASPVAGGNSVPAAGWSARGMFRPDGGLQSYVYSQNMKGQYGDVVVAKNFRFQTGRYYAVSYQVAVNDPASASNGYMKIFVNGVQVVNHQNIKFRSSSSTTAEISTLMFNTFHGGHTPEWAPRNADGSYAVDCAYYDNFAVNAGNQVRSAPGK
jgi:hypothetical protein